MIVAVCNGVSARRASIPRSWGRTTGVRAFTFRKRLVFICSRPTGRQCGSVNRHRESFSRLLLRKLKLIGFRFTSWPGDRVAPSHGDIHRLGP